MTGAIWPRHFFASYDTVSSGGPDVKRVWELNRHQHLPRLGKAYLLLGEERYAREVVAQMLGWIEQNPTRTGVHWYSSLEIAIRSLSWLWAVSEGRWVLSVLVGVACLVLRYRSGDEVVRRRLRWLVVAAAVIVVAVAPWALVAGTPILVLFTIPLLPAAVTLAVLRHQMLEIRLVVARGLAYALLSGLVLAAYAALVLVLVFTNMTGAVGRTSTFALCNVTLPWVMQLARLGIGSAMRQSPPLASAANIHRGRVTNEAVAETFGLKCEAIVA